MQKELHGFDNSVLEKLSEPLRKKANNLLRINKKFGEIFMESYSQGGIELLKHLISRINEKANVDLIKDNLDVVFSLCLLPYSMVGGIFRALNRNELDNADFYFFREILNKTSRWSKDLRYKFLDSLSILTNFDKQQRKMIYLALKKVPFSEIPAFLYYLDGIRLRNKNINVFLENATSSPSPLSYVYFARKYNNLNHLFLSRKVKEELKRAKNLFRDVRKEALNFLDELYGYYGIKKGCKEYPCSVLRDFENFINEMLSNEMLNNKMMLKKLLLLYKRINIEGEAKKLVLLSFLFSLKKFYKNKNAFFEAPLPVINEIEEGNFSFDEGLVIQFPSSFKGIRDIRDKIAVFNGISHETFHYVGLLNSFEGRFSPYSEISVYIFTRETLIPFKIEDIRDLHYEKPMNLLGRREPSILLQLGEGYLAYEYPSNILFSMIYPYLSKDELNRIVNGRKIGEIETKYFSRNGVIHYIGRIGNTSFNEELNSLLSNGEYNLTTLSRLIDMVESFAIKYGLYENFKKGLDSMKAFYNLLRLGIKKGAFKEFEVSNIIKEYINVYVSFIRGNYYERRNHLRKFYTYLVDLLKRKSNIKNPKYAYITFINSHSS